jgi:hypothetical protein
MYHRQAQNGLRTQNATFMSQRSSSEPRSHAAKQKSGKSKMKAFSTEKFSRERIMPTSLARSGKEANGTEVVGALPESRELPWA